MPPQRSQRTQPLQTFLVNAKRLNVELPKLVMDPSELPEFFKKFDKQLGTKSTVQLLHKSTNGSYDVKAKILGTNNTTMYNEKITFRDWDDRVKLLSIDSKAINSVPQTADMIHLIRCFDFEIQNQSNWVVQLELVKVLSNPLEFSAKLQRAKEKLADQPIDSLSSMDPTAYDFVRIKLIQTTQEAITQSQLANLIDSVVSKIENTNQDNYQAAIHSLAKDIFRDAIIISQFKRQSGFKRLCANTVELSRPIYFKQVLPNIDQYYLTDKMDGTRAMLIIDEVYRRSGHKRIYLGVNIYAVSDQIYEINRFQQSSNSKTIETDHTVLDVEMLNDKKQGYTFHCFDVIAFASKRLSGYPFKTRLEKFKDVQTLMDKHELGSVKTFVKLSKDSFPKQIKDFYSLKRSYHIDGLIFTPEGMHFKEAAKLKKSKFEKVFNTEYTNTISFKWKPLDQLTIDFYLMKHPNKKGAYVLCSGVDTSTFNRLQLEFFDGYKAPESPNAHKYFPIQFESYDQSFDYVWIPTKEEEEICSNTSECTSLNGMVGEFKFSEDGKYLSRPKLIKLRIDRVQDIAKGEYFGNALRYAELVWHSIKHPLDINQIYEATDIGYFAEDDNGWYKAQRNFNSFVKTYLMETYLYPKSTGNSTIIDVMAGKGQDLARAIDVGFDKVIAVDKDVDALYQLLERKYNLRVKRKDAMANIHVKNVDLEHESQSIIDSLKIPANSIDAAMCNFGIHYICHSALVNSHAPLEEFSKLMAHYLKKGSRLMITAFDGKGIHEQLANKAEWHLKESGRVKYSIKKEYSADEFTNLDQSIGVLLPFSDGYYSEFLVNYSYLQSVFENCGFKLLRADGFDSLLRSYKKNNPNGYRAMTDADKEWVSLYGYLIFERV